MHTIDRYPVLVTVSFLSLVLFLTTAPEIHAQETPENGFSDLQRGADETLVPFEGSSILNDPEMRVSRTWEDGEWMRESRRMYEYTEENDQEWVTIIHQVWNDTTDVWENSWKSVSIYNDFNLLADQKTYSWEDSSWVKLWDYNYDYNSKGRMTVWHRLAWNGTEWVDNQRRIHEYDSLVTRTSTLEQTWSDDSWSDTIRITYGYNDEAVKTEKQVEVQENGTWNLSERTTYTYDENGQPAETRYQIYQNGDWNNDTREVRTYQNGRMTEHLRQQWTDETWVDEWRLNRTYDEGQLITETEQAYTDGSWVNDTQTSYVYEASTPVEQYTGLPESYALGKNYPNPFNPSTTISFTVPEQEHVELHVYNVLGERVATLVDERRSAGEHSVEWHAENVPSGTYLYRLAAGAYTQTRKMMLVK